MTPASAGTTPPGTSDERQAAAWVQQMFAGIAPKYDLLNHLLSFNVDRRWRKVLMHHLRPVLQRPQAIILDLCCGTGDVLIDLKNGGVAHVLGADFCHPMLVSAKKKLARKSLQALLIEGDALQLPFAEDSLDAISIAFGFRNLANYDAGLQELYRVLKVGGMLAILEFSHPPGALIRRAYGFYSKVLLPVVGGAVSGSRKAYTYLPDSIRKFPNAAGLRQKMEAAGFSETRFELLTGGIAASHVGWKLTPRSAG